MGNGRKTSEDANKWEKILGNSGNIVGTSGKHMGKIVRTYGEIRENTGKILGKYEKIVGIEHNGTYGKLVGSTWGYQIFAELVEGNICKERLVPSFWV